MRDWTPTDEADAIDDQREREIEQGIRRRAAFERAMSPSGRPGIFNDHNCSRCQSGELPCVSGRSSTCEFPHARND